MGEVHEDRDDIPIYAAPSRSTDFSGLPSYGDEIVGKLINDVYHVGAQELAPLAPLRWIRRA